MLIAAMDGPHQRILLLGPTGVDKAVAGKRLAAHIHATLGHKVRFVDFENDYLKQHLSVRNLMSFLAQSSAQQSSTWLSAWTDFERSLTDGVTILGLHATYVSGVLGLRCPVNIPKICEVFRPSVIVSLIDDIGSMWARTEARAGGKDYKGRPSFEQLLVARRAEQFLGDLLVSHTGAPRTRHLLCAAGNCLEALANVIISMRRLRTCRFRLALRDDWQQKAITASFS